MRPLLLRGALVAMLLLAVVAVGPAAQPQQASSPAPASSTKRLSFIGNDPDPIPRRMIRPSPDVQAAPPQLVAVPARQSTVRPKPAAPPPAPPAPAAVGTGQWGLINQDRQAAGLPPLQWNACLANVAIGQAQRMAAQGYISHANGRALDLACHLGARASESIGFQGHINDAAMNAWFMGDPPHRANIMGPYHFVGVAWVVAANGTAYLAIEFG